jgi:hypothetical protein
MGTIHAALICSAIGQTLFVALYVSAPWWRDFVGRALFVKSIVLAVVFDIAVAAIWWVMPMVVWQVLYWLIAAAIWQQFAALVWQRHLGRRRRARSRIG